MMAVGRHVWTDITQVQRSKFKVDKWDLNLAAGAKQRFYMCEPFLDRL